MQNLISDVVNLVLPPLGLYIACVECCTKSHVLGMYM